MTPGGGSDLFFVDTPRPGSSCDPSRLKQKIGFFFWFFFQELGRNELNLKMSTHSTCTWREIFSVFTPCFVHFNSSVGCSRNRSRAHETNVLMLILEVSMFEFLSKWLEAFEAGGNMVRFEPHPKPE